MNFKKGEVIVLHGTEDAIKVWRQSLEKRFPGEVGSFAPALTPDGEASFEPLWSAKRRAILWEEENMVLDLYAWAKAPHTDEGLANKARDLTTLLMGLPAMNRREAAAGLVAVVRERGLRLFILIPGNTPGKPGYRAPVALGFTANWIIDVDRDNVEIYKPVLPG